MENEKRDALETLLANRHFLYALFHRLFGQEPDEALMGILTDQNTALSFSLLSEGEGDPMVQAVHYLEKLRTKQQQEHFMDELMTEYTRFFIGPKKLPAPPWESVYTGREEMLFQESTLAVRNAYRANGFLPKDYPRVADDSLALELDFMAHMAERALTAFRSSEEAEAEKALEASRRFLNEHLLVWTPRFLERLKRGPEGQFYPQMSLILSWFLQSDHRLLEELQESIQPS